MLNKTIARLLRKESGKPLHCIDASVFLESTLDTKLGEICKSHLNNMGRGKYFRGVMPISVLGEINLVIFRDIKEPAERMAKFDLLEKLIRLRNIDFIIPEKEDYKLIAELLDTERLLETTDAQHVVCAKRAGAHAFITLDNDLINNKNIESALNLKIAHPSEFVNI